MKKILAPMFIVLAIATAAYADNYPSPNQPSPPPPPGYSDIYGPGRTVRWQDMGVIQAQKFIALDVQLNAHGQFVNEIFFAAIDNHIGIKSARARLANGQMIDLGYLNGTIYRGQQLRFRLDYYYSLRIDSIYLTIESPNVVGARASLATQLGLAY